MYTVAYWSVPKIFVKFGFHLVHIYVPPLSPVFQFYPVFLREYRPNMMILSEFSKKCFRVNFLFNLKQEDISKKKSGHAVSMINADQYRSMPDQICGYLNLTHFCVKLAKLKTTTMAAPVSTTFWTEKRRCFASKNYQINPNGVFLESNGLIVNFFFKVTYRTC